MSNSEINELLFHATGLSIDDVAEGTIDDKSLIELQEIHFRFFPGHEHVINEIRVAHEAPSSSAIRHAWLLRHGANPVGEFIFHTCLKRRIAVLHFVAVNEMARETFSLGWFEHLINAVSVQADHDLATHGKVLLALAAEVQDTQRWMRTDFHTVEIGYQEPHHGMHWANFGEPSFFDINLVVKITATGRLEPYETLISAVAKAFLVDHYCLDEENPVVANIIKSAESLSTRE